MKKLLLVAIILVLTSSSMGREPYPIVLRVQTPSKGLWYIQPMLPPVFAVEQQSGEGIREQDILRCSQRTEQVGMVPVGDKRVVFNRVVLMCEGGREFLLKELTWR